MNNTPFSPSASTTNQPIMSRNSEVVLRECRVFPRDSVSASKSTYPNLSLENLETSESKNPKSRASRSPKRKRTASSPPTTRSPPSQAPTASALPDPLPFNVGGTLYLTSHMTLSVSPVFREWLSSGGGFKYCESTGLYFYDGDPETFGHVLRYMRRPWAYPLLWTLEGGFDFAMYHRVSVEAGVLGLKRLQQWILEEGYREAVEGGAQGCRCGGMGVKFSCRGLEFYGEEFEE